MNHSRTTFLLAIAAALAILSTAVLAETQTVDGIEWTYTVSGDTASVGGGSYYASRAVPTNTTGAIVIPSTLGGYPVTSIGDYAFRDCSGLTSVTIGNTVTDIWSYAFYGCSGLTSVTIPDSVASIGDSAFRFCSGLTSVTIPDSVTDIWSSAFYGCSGLTSVTIPDSVASIGDSAFRFCSGLTSVTIPDSVTSIGGYAFESCRGLTNVTIGNSVASIGGKAFSGCGSMESFSVADGNPAFKAVSGLLLTKDGMTLIAGVNGAVVIPDSVTSIGSYAFSGCSGLTSVTIPDSVTSIGEAAFYNCSSLTSVTIPNSVTSIGKEAFCECSGLTSVTIPDSVTSIGSSAFSQCGSLESFSVADGNPAFKAVSGLLLTKDGMTLIAGVNGAVVIPDSVTSIGSYAFSGCSGLTSVTIPDSVTSIGYEAFEGCNGLTSVTIPQCVCSGQLSEVFPNAYDSITNVVISGGVTNIGDYTFQGCSGLTSVTIPDSVVDLSTTAFDGCSKLWTSWYRTLANLSASGGASGGGSSGGGSSTPVSQTVALTVTNVIVHYVTPSLPSGAVTPDTASAGIVNIVAEVTANKAVAISPEWAKQYPSFAATFGSDFSAALTKPTGKRDGAGNPMYVWQDYVAGTDPTDPTSVFTASVTFDAETGAPVIGWSPELSPAEAAKRLYTIYGKVRLTDPDWLPFADDPSPYNFFRLTVEMK